MFSTTHNRFQTPSYNKYGNIPTTIMPIIIEMREEKPALTVLEEPEVIEQEPEIIEVKENITQCEEKIVEPEEKIENITQCEEKIVEPEEKIENITQCEEEIVEFEVIEVKENITQCEEKIVEPEETITVDEEEIEYQPTTPPPSNNPLFVEPTDFVLDDIYTNYADDDFEEQKPDKKKKRSVIKSFLKEFKPTYKRKLKKSKSIL